MVAPFRRSLPNSVGLDRRSSQRIHLRFPVSLFEGAPRPAAKPLLGNAQTINVSADGVYLRAFEPVALRPGKRVHVRIAVPEPYLSDGSTGGGVSVLWPLLDGPAEVVRIERVVGLAIDGLGIALRMLAPLRFASDNG